PIHILLDNAILIYHIALIDNSKKGFFMNKLKEFNISEKLTTLIFYISILFFFIGFNFRDTSTGFWYQQNLPNLNGASIKDMVFLDSLTGFAVTLSPAYILKTTNGGDNWNIIYNHPNAFYRIQFPNKDSGYVLSINQFLKTTNGGANWSVITFPNEMYPSDIYALSFDTLWVAGSYGFEYGIFRSIDGGNNWQLLHYGDGPQQIYMYNKDIGFEWIGNGYLKKTTDGGFNWVLTDMSFISGDGYTDLKFIDTITGLLARGVVKKSTNGGLNWSSVNLVPETGQIFASGITKLSFINKDTIWGFGVSRIRYPNGHYRGFIQKSTNGGVSWGYQMPDTGIITMTHYDRGQFVNKLNGWAYQNIYSGIHTTTGGMDTIIFVGIENITQISPKNFELRQNYPNPYNNSTLIEYYLNEQGMVKLKIFDMTGREMTTLVNEVQNAGGYGVPVAIQLSSGVYFYKMFYVNKKGEMQIDTKKMVLIK
ncbi:MAG: T9SS type A sorting domain-containing protein, partial [Ignavibacteriae bacterium]|nr:T9SS type A sorting domain-containing protein [Ignavibacteriota bacterium]